ncbi:MAG: 30S ribosomal protein S11 [bacterium]|nr:30S ribosomal protein S11 [bacterium]
MEQHIQSLPGKKQKTPTQVEKGRVYITATFNNTLATVTDLVGNALVWGSAGSVGFKGARKSTPFAATAAVEQVIRKAMARGMKDVEIYVRGPGNGRDGAIRAIRAAGMNISLLADVTPIPHNGVRAKKRRRV